MPGVAKSGVLEVSETGGGVAIDVNVVKSPLIASAPTFILVSITSIEAVAANASRKGLALVNLSGNTISFGIAVPAVLNSGITLRPNGVWEMDEYTFATGAINAIAAGASSPLSIQEFV